MTLRVASPDKYSFHFASLSGYSPKGQPPKELIAICFGTSYSMTEKAEFSDMQRYHVDPHGKVLLTCVTVLSLSC